MKVAALRDDPTMEMASAHVGIDRPPRKNSSVSDLCRLSRHAATNPMTSISARYEPSTTQSTNPNAARVFIGGRRLMDHRKLVTLSSEMWHGRLARVSVQVIAHGRA